MRIKWKHLSSKEKDELIGEAVKALVELSKGEPDTIPTRKQRYWVEEFDYVPELRWAVCGEEMKRPVCYCCLKEEAELICDALNRSQTCL